MKIKRFFLILMFIFSFAVVVFPVVFSGCYCFNEIFSILRYEENRRSVFLNKSLHKDSNDRLRFLDKTNGVFGVLSCFEDEIIAPIYCDSFFDGLKKCCFIGDYYEPESYFIRLKSYFFENFFSKLEELKPSEYIYFDVFGENKEFVVEEVKTVFEFDEIARKPTANSLEILVDMPFSNNYNKILIRAKYLGIVEGREKDFYSLMSSRKYLMVLAAFLSFILIFLVLEIIKKINAYSRRRKKLIKYVRKKYLVDLVD